MLKPEDENAVNERGIRNVAFLIEMQVRRMAELGEDGPDACEAEATLRRLMDLEAALRSRAEVIRAGRNMVYAAA